MESYCPLLDEYLALVDDTEPPTLYHRWCMLSNIAALAHRRTKIAMPTGDIYPNTYIILLGPPAARKSTAINIATSMLKNSGFNRIASGKTTPQKFLTDLYEGFDKLSSAKSNLDFDLDSTNLDAEIEIDISDVLISEGELQDFFGINNFDFISMITNLFDNKTHYDNRTKTGESQRIVNPTISLMGGTTNSGFKKMFPLEIIGQGLLSRFLLIHGAGARKKVFMPKKFDEALEKDIVNHLSAIRTSKDMPRSFEFDLSAYDYSQSLYESTKDEISDSRFEYYNGRRNSHYMKLATLIAIANMHSVIELNDCILANTILSYTEKFMPKALGEFGLDKGAETTDTIYGKIVKSAKGLTIPELMKECISAVNSMSELSTHLLKLHSTDRIDRIQDDKGTIRYIAISRTVNTKSKMVDYSILKEFQENPTFDTAIRSNPDTEIEYDIEQAMIAEAESNLKFEVIGNE